MSELLYRIDVDLRGSNFPQAESVCLLMDGSTIGPHRLRELTADHYDIPIQQVGRAILTTRQAYEESVRDLP